MIVYKITNTINDKVYIGITKCTLSKRWAEHKCKSKSLCSHLYLSIKKYGTSFFKIESIESSTKALGTTIMARSILFRISSIVLKHLKPRIELEFGLTGNNLPVKPNSLMDFKIS